MVRGTVLAAGGFAYALRRLGPNLALAWVTALVVAVGGAGSIKAGIYPAPDPRHASGFIGPLMILTPVLFFFALLGRSDARAVRAYLLLCMVQIAAVFPFMTRMLDPSGYDGLAQRVFTLAVFPPIAVVSFYLARRLRRPVPIAVS